MSAAGPFLDVRPEAAFEAGHRPGAASVPLEELARRIHELPPRDEAIAVFDEDGDRARAAVLALRARGYGRAVVAGPEAGASGAGAVETGPSRARLWRPTPLVEDALPRVVAALGGPGRALDLGMGTGRNAVFVALSGFTVEGIDILPDACERALDLARRHGVAGRLRARVLDLARAPASQAVAVSAFDLIVVVGLLERPLLPAIRAGVRPGGFVLYETFLEEQRRRFGKPRSEARLLAPGELRAAFEGFAVEIYREGLAAPRRFVASLLARRPPVA